MKPTSEPTEVKLTNLAGKWYIHYSDFPMWLKGDKLFPTFNYSLGRRGGTSGLEDEVKYIKDGRQKSISGFDTPTHERNVSFVWRGKGLMSLLKSEWEILYVDPAWQWAIIHFQKTLFTPEGYDVIGRDKQLSQEQEQCIQEKLDEFGIKSRLVQIDKS